MSGYSTEYIKEKLTKELEASEVVRQDKQLQKLLTVQVVDQSDGCGAKFAAVVVSSKFEGKPLLQRHRLVNAALEEELKTIHAFSQKTLTPKQWEEQSQKSS